MRGADRTEPAVADAPDLAIPLWCDADFSWARVAEHARNGPMPSGYIDAFGRYLRRGLSEPLCCGANGAFGAIGIPACHSCLGDW